MAIPYDLNNVVGLTETCAAQRLREKGYNELPSSQQRSVLAILLAVFWAARALGHPDDGARRASVFATLVVANLCLILTNRSWSRTVLSMFREPNAALWWVLGGTSLMLTLVLSVPFLRDLFHFSRLHAADVAVFVVAGVISITWFELLKVLKAKLA